MNRRPRILLIPNASWWIIGEMAKQIVARFSYKYDFLYFSELVLERRPDLLASLIKSADAIHCLNESSIDLFNEFEQRDLPPIITWIHHITTWSPQHQKAMELSSELTVCTDEWKAVLAKRAFERPITIVKHGVDMQFFRYSRKPTSKFGIPAESFVVGFLASSGSDRDNNRKGIDVFKEVVIRAATQIQNFHIVIGGPGWDNLVKDLKARGISASATGFIRKSDLPLLYSSLDAYLLTSRIEGGPCTVFEAMSCGIPVVSTAVGAVPELIVNGVNGYSAAVDDCEGLLLALVKLNQSPDLRKIIGTNALETVSQRSWSNTLSPLEGVYDRVLQQRAPSERYACSHCFPEKASQCLQAVCAADALAWILPRIRHRSIGMRRGIRELHEMLEGLSVIDIGRGIRMLQRRSARLR